MPGKNRGNINVGLEVKIVLKENQHSGLLTSGFVEKILTNSMIHPHGIKVRLQTGEVKEIVK
jgi:uncharacterized repeat protein (TIGR03833 family)